jgi:hypothetical protein
LPQEQAASHSCCDDEQPKSKACSQDCCSSFTASTTQNITTASLEAPVKLLPTILHFVFTELQAPQVTNLLHKDEVPIFSRQLATALPLGANAPPVTLKA